MSNRVARTALEKEKMAKEEAIRLALLHKEEDKKKELDGFDALLKQCPRLEKHLRKAPTGLYGGGDANEKNRQAVTRLLNHWPPNRKLADWEPQGMSFLNLFRSLCRHLLGKYPMPAFLWNIFFASEPQYQQLGPSIHMITQGGSLAAEVKSNGIPIPLTKRMCHLFMQSSPDTAIVTALRTAQAKGNDLDPVLFQALMGTHWGQGIRDREVEEFWQTCLLWFRNQGMLEKAKVGPLLDFIMHKWTGDRKYSLKGRTGLSVQQAMEAWHAEMNNERRVGQYGEAGEYKPSGFRAATFDLSKKTDDVLTHMEIWSIHELLSYKELKAEGVRQHHCVSSYGSACARGATSIWSLVKEDFKGRWAMLTVEVDNANRMITQARGICNRPAKEPELRLLRRWGTEAGLSLTNWVATRWM